MNWQNKLTDQDLNVPYLVLYNKSAKDANSTIVKRSEIDLEFVVENKAYSFSTYNLDEAYYLSAMLNSTFVNESMKDFQTHFHNRLLLHSYHAAIIFLPDLSGTDLENQ